MDNRYFDECMNRINRGDKNALREIYEEYLEYVYSIAFSLLKNKEDAEDAASEIFIRLWNSSASYKAGTGHKGYLASMTRNLSIDLLRKRKRELTGSDLQPDEEERTNDIAEGIEPGFEEETVERLSMESALEKLPDDEREILNHKLIGQLTFKEISTLLKMPAGTVSWKYREALKKLRRYVNGKEY